VGRTLGPPTISPLKGKLAPPKYSLNVSSGPNSRRKTRKKLQHFQKKAPPLWATLRRNPPPREKRALLGAQTSGAPFN